MPQTKNVDISPGGTTPIIHVSQNDVGRAITLNVSDGTGWYDLTGCSAALAGVKPSGLGFTIAGTVSGHTVTITTEKLMTSEYGNIACELKITKGDVKIGTANMILAVEKDPHPEHTTDGNVDELIPEITVLVERAEAASETALENALKAEGYATGKQNGTDVASDSPYYENNAEYYKEKAGQHETNAGASETNAANSALEASGSASAASASALASEGYAVGKQNGTDVASDSPYHENNAKHYKEQAETLVGNLATEETLSKIKSGTNDVVSLLQQIVEEGGHSGDLNGFSLNLGVDDELLITYTDPEDETDTVTITAPTNTTMSAIVTVLEELADVWKGAIEANE